MAGLARGLGILFALQLFTRLLSFAVNAFLARSLGPAWYAFANVQLHLVASTALFLPKEGFRRAAQRIYPGGEGSPLAWGMNVAWLSVPAAALVAGLLVAAAACTGAQGEWEALMGRSEARATLLVSALAAVVEAACEPGWVYAQANLLLSQRALAEGAALVAKALTACALVLRAVSAGHAMDSGHAVNGGSSPSNHRGLGLAFGLSQLAYSISLLALLYALAAPRCPSQSLAPHRTPADVSPPTDGSATAASAPRWLPRRVWVLTAQSVAQAAQKYVLTEGERLVVVATSPIESQGVYALVTNFISLVGARRPPLAP
jgi:oligosaccharide translocation protein RFT1